MREATALAQGGLSYKAGAKRRIAITMDESLFLYIRDRAVAEDRSISAQIVRYLQLARQAAQRNSDKTNASPRGLSG